MLFFNTPDKPAGVDNPNYLAAMQAAHALGISEDICLKIFSEFKGVEHRLEFVRDLGGVDFINDSKSTTVEAGRWALERAVKAYGDDLRGIRQTFGLFAFKIFGGPKSQTYDCHRPGT